MTVETTYRVEPDEGDAFQTTSPEDAETSSKDGARVTASTRRVA
ncbi:hypothetical protein [Halorarum salinum]|nr:hypothetical protein [Halobaculum salinum]